MIEVTKLDKNGTKFDINPDLIKKIKDGPSDSSVITMINESIFNVVERRLEIKEKIHRNKVSVVKNAVKSALEEIEG